MSSCGDVAFATMEDLPLEALIADVVANPTPDRVPCKSTPPTTVGRSSPSFYRSIRTIAGAILRRIRR